jgi:NTE family protein
MRIGLNRFEDVEQEQLINCGYALCDAAVRPYAPTADCQPIVAAMGLQ